MSNIRVIVSGAGGRMGRMIVAAVSRQEDMEVTAAVEASTYPYLGEDAGVLAGMGGLGVLVVDSLSEVTSQGDVLIDFTTPDATLANLAAAVEKGMPTVIATTGFDEDQEAELDRLSSQVPCVIAPNYSVGINVLLKAVELAAGVLGDGYDVEIVEAHHNQKKDAPSGTALRLAQVAARALSRDLRQTAIYGRQGIVGARPDREIGIHAVRGGDIVGDHTVLFAGLGERLELTHRAQSRETFASGAVRAARWVVDAPTGRHSFEDILFGTE